MKRARKLWLRVTIGTAMVKAQRPGYSAAVGAIFEDHHL